MHLYLITILVFLLWVGIIGGLAYAMYYVVWKPTKEERLAKAERARRIADRRG